MAAPQLFKATGIILKRNNVGEGDKILTVLCEHVGKKRFIAKGVRKVGSRRASHLGLFSKTDFLIHKGKMLDSITGATARHLYGSSYTHLGQIACAYTACEVIDRLIMEGQEHDNTYDLLDTVLSDIETKEYLHLPIILQEFIDELLMTLGFRRKETRSNSLGEAIYRVETVIERKIRSKSLLSRSGISL
jgi:DNA repair protein RecO (recombination protein O)